MNNYTVFFDYDFPKTVNETPIFGEIKPAAAYRILLKNTRGARLLSSGQVPGILHNGGVVEDNEPAENVMWVGKVPNKTGLYHCVGLLDGQEFINNVKQLEPSELSKLRDWGTGVGDSKIKSWPGLWVESDRADFKEQLKMISNLMKYIGAPNVMVLSGDSRVESAEAAGVDLEDILPGKSIQAYWRFDEPNLNWVLQEKLEKMLIIATAGDPAICTRARKMRAFGVKAKDNESKTRLQTIIYANDEIRMSTAHFEWGLEEYLEDNGWDLDQGWAALGAAENLFKDAKRAAKVSAEISPELAKAIQVYESMGDVVRVSRKVLDLSNPNVPKEIVNEFEAAKKVISATLGIISNPPQYQTKSSNYHSPGGYEGDSLAPNTPLNFRDGGGCELSELPARLGTGQKIRLATCPIPGHVHQTPDAGAGVTDKGLPYVRCFSGRGATVYMERSNQQPKETLKKQETAPAPKPTGKINWPVWIESLGKDGEKNRRPSPIALENTRALLEHYGIEVRTNLLTHRAEVTAKEEFLSHEMMQNAGTAHVRNLGRKHGLSVEAIKDHLSILFGKNAYNPVTDWLNEASWDGVDRIEPLLDSLTLAQGFSKSLARRLLTTWLVTAAKAALVPPNTINGVKSQGVFVLQGQQGAGKTRWLASLAPADSGWIKTGMILDPEKRDSVQQCCSYWLTELGELDSTFRKDVSRLKAFITEDSDCYRTAYDPREEKHPRRTVFAGSVNQFNFLVDSTGNRRFWVVPVTRCNPEHKIDIQQLWCQVETLARNGAKTWLDSETERELNESNLQFQAVDPIMNAFDRCFEIQKGVSTDQSELVRIVRDDLGGTLDIKGTRHLLKTLRDRLSKLNMTTRESHGKIYWPIANRVSSYSGVARLPGKDVSNILEGLEEAAL